MIARNCLLELREIWENAPVSIVGGGRQTGKSTLVRMFLESQTDTPHRFINLDDEQYLSAAHDDPDSFARQFPQGTLVIDEVQRAPQLFRAIKGALEEDRRPGRFILTGSSNLTRLEGRQESLAGRAAYLRLEGLSQGELHERREDFVNWAWNIGQASGDPAQETQLLAQVDGSELARHEYFERAVTSDSPALLGKSSRWQRRWLDNYLDLVLSHDVSEVSGIRYPDRLRKLLEVLAADNAGEISGAALSRALDIPATSLSPYLQTLEDVFLLRRLPAWSNNLLKRPVSRPKVYLRDAAMAANICGLDAQALDADISATITGGLLEGFVVGELAKQAGWSQVSYCMYHFRDSTGPEVDIVLENRRRQVVAIEVKSTTSVASKHFKGLKYLQERIGQQLVAGILLHTGKRAIQHGERLYAVPISALWSV